MRAAYVTTTRSPRATDVRSAVAENWRDEGEEEDGDEERDFLEREEGDAAEAAAPAVPAAEASFTFEEKAPLPAERL
jgi:hypothetical protein